tara:strand:+ start:427 stop:564 length:138 start_codon:yes stop_codon:yes gene_type:complete
MEETISFLYTQVRALQKRVEILEEENNILKEGCEEAAKLINKIIE